MNTELTDRQLLDKELAAYTAAGWRIVSQTDSGFQAAAPKKLNPVGMAVFVITPGVLSLIALLIAPAWGVLLGIVTVLGFALVVADYAVKKPTLTYVTADGLRVRTTAPKQRRNQVDEWKAILADDEKKSKAA